MTRVLQIGHLLLLVAGIAFLGILGWRTWRVSDELDAVLAHADTNLSELNVTLQEVNRPCGTKIKGLTLPCGILARMNKTVVKIGDAVVTTQEQERAIAPHTIAAMDNLNRAAHSIAETANAAAQTAQAASVDLSTLNTSIAATQSLIDDSDALVKQYSLAAPGLIDTSRNVSRMTDSGAKMLKDAQEKEHALLHPAKKKLTFWGGFWVGMTYVHKMLPPIF